MRETVQKTLEDARQKGVIGSGLEAKVIFKTSDSQMKAFLEETKALWPEIAIVSAVEVQDGDEPLTVTAEHASGVKCARCWQWKTEVGQPGRAHSDLCDRCAAVLEREGLSVPQETPVA